MIAGGATSLFSESLRDRSSMAHFHFFDGTRIQINLLKHWTPENPADFEGAYQDNGFDGGMIIIAHKLNPEDTESQIVYSGSFVHRPDRNSKPLTHNFSNLSVIDGKIEDEVMKGRFYRYPDYETQREYYCVRLNDRIYVKADSKRRRIDVDELENP